MVKEYPPRDEAKILDRALENYFSRPVAAIGSQKSDSDKGIFDKTPDRPQIQMKTDCKVNKLGPDPYGVNRTRSQWIDRGKRHVFSSYRPGPAFIQQNFQNLLDR
ncbi:hypothetical protein CYMTET_42461 [Cymbomonas tetramitiformis]|uniref:Uncharacterized protein n=1 Tax=Cymbomonas tetramitiformis TaxID=36881 RepID=A0AAE0F0Z5_9CHLO|nr:hypothetical protein CYMTET_42461 [Cymbomonas tetramitiformis]